MAHKKNNPIQSLGEQPFEQMLRRHLQRGGETANPCPGFDAETANAYLERALLAPAQQTFEMHLADCSICRQHVIALARLNTELAPAPVIVATPQSITEPFWTRWMTQASAWWNEFSWSWGLAGAGATASVLIAALAFYSLQQAKDSQPALSLVNNAPAELRVQDEAATTTNTTVSEAFKAIAPAETLPMNAPLPKRENGVASNEAVVANRAIMAQPLAVPRLPELPPNAITAGAIPAPPQMHVMDAPLVDMAFNSERPSAPVIALPSSTDFFPSAARQGGVMTIGLNPGNGMRSYRLDSSEPLAPVGSLNRVKDQLEKQSTLAELAPDEARRKRASKDAKEDKSEPGRVRELIEMLKPQSSFGLVARKKADAPTKEADKTTDSPLTKPMTKQVNGHTLYFERGMWIDEDYKSSMTLPLIKLIRGSQRYQQVLIDNPMLEEFFQLAPVIVVWKGKIYEVRKGQ